MRAVLAILAIAILAAGGWYLLGQRGATPAAGAGTAPTSPAADSFPAPAKAEEPVKPAEKTAVPPPAPAGGFGTLRGVVKYVGVAAVLPPRAIPQNDQGGCHGATVPDESLIVDPATNGIKWAIIRILDVKPNDAPPLPATPPQMDQKGCMFSPHVLVIPPKSDLEILNPDGINHNFKTFGLEFISPERNPLIPANVKKYTYPGKDFPEPEIIQVTCTIHGWMKAFIVVHDPRYCAVTGTDGKFEIKNIPAGTHKVSAWHEKFGDFEGKESHSIVIKPGETTDMGELKFKPKEK